MLDSLIEVSLPQNGIYHEGISALAQAFGNNKNLEVIDYCLLLFNYIIISLGT